MGLKFAQDIDLACVASKIDGYSGAVIKDPCNKVIRGLFLNSYTQRGLTSSTQGKESQDNSAFPDTKTQKNDKKE